jgi:hypothetical protein
VIIRCLDDGRPLQSAGCKSVFRVTGACARGVVALGLLCSRIMMRATKASHDREDEVVERDEVAAPRVQEHDVDHDDPAHAKLGDDGGYDGSYDDLVEEIDLDELAAMEGPDASDERHDAER